LSKAASFADKFSFKFASAAGKSLAKDGSASLETSGDSNRKFNGSAEFTSGRTFIDRMSVTVIDVLPNGNLVVEGARCRMAIGKSRTVRVTGITRPADAATRWPRLRQCGVNDVSGLQL